MNQTESVENIKQQTTSNVEKLNVESKKSKENKSSKKKNIIIAITIVILILIIIGLIVYIILMKKDDDKNKLPVPETDNISLNTTIIENEIISEDISDFSDSSDSNETPKLSDSSISDAVSTIYKSDSYETIMDTEEFPSESI